MKTSAYQNYLAFISVVLVGILGGLFPAISGAGVYNSSAEVTYKEYWVSHDEFVGDCTVTPPTFYIEPGAGACAGGEITVNLDIPDDLTNATRAEIYLDLWRNRDTPSARFTLNGNATVYNPGVGSDWSRTPYVGDVTLSELQQNNNTITFSAASGLYHVHDIAIRLYYDSGTPLVPGAGSDVIAPTGSLTGVAGGNPAISAVLDVNSNTLTLTATAADDQAVDYVEFHGYYYGYDEDNDGEFVDWHNIKHPENNPGSDGTIDHIGTDAGAGPSYSATWDLSHIPNQSGVKFKVRIVDTSGNVREAASGVSADFTLSRSNLVESYLIHKFEDDVLHHDGDMGFFDTITRNIILPNDLSDVTAAYMVGAFWRNPSISINSNTAFDAFASCTTTHCWEQSIRSIPVSDLVAGNNQIDYIYSGSGFGEFIEKPGPMIVLVRSRSPAPTAVPFISDEFNDVALDTDVWTYIDAIGDSALAMTGTQAQISVPGGVRHDLWEGANNAPRILQPAADTDFELEVKIDSRISVDAELQGILIQEDVNKFIRFGFFYNAGPEVRMIAATFDDGIPTTQHTPQVSPTTDTTPLYMRVERVGDDWTQSYSPDGTTWTPEPTFTFAMSVREVGLYAGNAGTDPAHIGLFDYFATTAINIVTDPVSQAINEGGSVTFTVEALGLGPITYQWKKDGVDIGGETAASLTINPVAVSDAADYTVVATNAAGSVTSAAATLTVNVAPAITTDPVSQAINEGSPVTFTVVATGTPAPTYQWKKDGVDIGGETAASLTINPVAVSDAADYTVVATNAAGSVTSAAATLTVNVAPAITTDPVSQAINEGSPVTFTVVATGTPAPTYQWKKDGVDIGGETAASLTINPVAVSDAADYTVVATNAAGSVTSAAATLTVNVAPAITTQPADQSIVEGSPATFTVVATGTPAPTYQWKRDGVDIGGATSASYTLPATLLSDNGAQFTVVVTNSVNSVTSAAATLTVTAAPIAVSITTDPVDQTVNEGATATFSVVAAGTAPFTYQWKKDAVDIAGATSASYTTPATTAADDGAVFTVVVTNAVNSVTSAGATLTVNLAPVITTQPADQTVAAGATATFDVVATNAVSYQWQKDSADIAGATSASYTTPTTTVADDGSTYQVVVTNASGSVTSSAATLTIDSNGDGLSDADAIALGLDPDAAGGDSDGDGVSDVAEIGGDVNNPLDSDADGVIDALEPGADSTDAMVASGLQLPGGVSASVTTGAGLALSAVSVADASGAPAGISFPFGTLSYTTTVTVPGDSVTVRMTFSSDLPASIDLYKVDGGGTYTLLPTTVWTRVDDRNIDITLTDGDPQTDLDGAADGSIEDPVAIADVTPAPTTSSGGGGGCALNTSSVSQDPTFPLLMLISIGYLFRRRSGGAAQQA